MILTSKGKGLRFDSNQLRDQGRVTRGVRGIKLKENDEVVNLLKVDDENFFDSRKKWTCIRTQFSSFLPRGETNETKKFLLEKRWARGYSHEYRGCLWSNKRES